MPNNGSAVPVLYEVCRTLRFVNGSAVTLPLKLCSDEASAKEALAQLIANYNRAKETGRYTVLGEFGVEKVLFGVLPVQAPDSTIIRPAPQLFMPGR